MTVYQQIKELRESLGMTQQELAEKVGFKTASAVNKIELGLRDINQGKIVAFANALGTTPGYLMGWEESVYTKKEEFTMPKTNKNNDKLVFTPKRFSESRNCRVRLTDDAAEIVNNIWLRTGLSATQIVSSMIEYAAERVEIERTAFDDDD